MYCFMFSDQVLGYKVSHLSDQYERPQITTLNHFIWLNLQKGYQSCHHSSSSTHCKRSTEDPKEDPNRLEHGCDIKGVTVVSSRLIRDY